MTDSDDAWIDHLQAKDKNETSRNARLAAAIAAGKSPLDDETERMIRAYVKANLDVPGPRVGQLLAELDQLRAASANNIHVRYTIDDDGIWLVCMKEPVSDAYLTNLGFEPSVNEIIDAAQKHITEKHT